MTDRQPVRAVIFDLDGTLINSEPLHAEALTAVLSPLGARVSTAQYVGRPDDVVLREALQSIDHDASPNAVAEIHARKSALVVDWYATGRLTAQPGAPELVRACAQRVNVAVCTAARRNEAEAAMRGLGLTDVLHALVTADDTRDSKPDPAPYRLACARLDANPSECVALEDSPTGLTSALAARLRTVALLHTTPIDQLPGAHAHVRSIDLIDADALLAGEIV
ncbi:MAG: HAD family phosphatase [Planctomycetota bacterium]